MTDYREILRLAEMGLNRTNIGVALGYSRNTVADVLRRAQIKGIELPLPDDMSDRELADLLYPEKAKDQNHKMPDCERIHKELGQKSVTLTLLWEEYCRECRQNGEIPYAFVSMEQLSLLWLDDKKIQVKESTYARYDQVIHGHIIPYFKGMDSNRISNIIISQFVKDKLAHGRIDKSGGLLNKSVCDIIL